jgi:hypothetical protein
LTSLLVLLKISMNLHTHYVDISPFLHRKEERKGRKKRVYICPDTDGGSNAMTGQDLSRTHVVLCAVFLIHLFAPQDMCESRYVYTLRWSFSPFIILLERGEKKEKSEWMNISGECCGLGALSRVAIAHVVHQEPHTIDPGRPASLHRWSGNTPARQPGST